MGPQFQFHKGTIKTISNLTNKLILRHFNSIKVRLKRLGRKGFDRNTEFQFHKGTIKTQAIYGNTVASNISIP